MGDAFSPDYATARARFRAAARARVARVEAHPIAGAGPGGEELAIDAALIGDEDPARLVIVSGGLHGVEGYLGSAIQQAILEGDLAAEPPPGSALLLLHALDPYGYAWTRRVNEANVDLNRNFLADDAPYAGSPPLYGHLDPWLNPRRPPRRPSGFLPLALLTILRHGLPALKDAVAFGQYDYPRGLFFGGHAPSATQRLLAEHLPRWAGAAGQILHVDVHTGLGPRGTCKLLLDEEMADRAPWLAGVFGAGTVEVSEPNGTAYHSRGDLLTWCRSRPFAGRCYDGVCAEFGTDPALRVLTALRAENQAYHWCTPDDPAARRARSRLRAAFAPADPRWRSRTLARGLAIVRRALAACFAADGDRRGCVPV